MIFDSQYESIKPTKYARRVLAALASAGIVDARLVRSWHRRMHDGDMVEVRLDPVDLTFVRYRGDDLVYLGTSTDSSQWRNFGDVAIALGWRPAEADFTRREFVKPEDPLEDRLAMISGRFDELADAVRRGPEFYNRVDDIARERGKLVDRIWDEPQ